MIVSTSKSKQKLSDRYSSGSGNTGNSNNKRFVSKPVIVAITAVVVVAAVVIVIALLGGRGKESNDASNYNLVVTPDNSDELATKTDSNAVPNSFTASMNSEWQFFNGESASDNAYVANITTNTHPVNFVLKRNDTGAVIYESPIIPVGGNLTNIKLDDTSLSKGTYPCTVTYRLLDKDGNQLSHVNVSVNVIIKND